jgi:hypothetical protein
MNLNGREEMGALGYDAIGAIIEIKLRLILPQKARLTTLMPNPSIF